MPNAIMMMLGADGVGKTTLLATMYHELSHITDPTHFELTANEDTHKDLQDAYQKLSTIVTQPTFTPTGPLLKGTAGIIERQFEIRFRGKKEFDLTFCDIAGGVIHAQEGNPNFAEFKNKLRQSIVIMNVIDGSALIEGDELLVLKKNEPTQIYELLLPILKNKRDYLLLFVITKCEVWLKNEWRQKQLEMTFEKQNEMLLELIDKLDNVVGVLIPVKTLGCVEFTHIDYQNNDTEMIFVRKPNLQFKPENIDQPLRYALAFALLQHNQKRTQWNKLVRWLWNKDVAFRKALNKFAAARQKKFKIYGNASLIEVTK